MELDELMDSGLGIGTYQIGILTLAFMFSFISTDSFAINFIAGKMNYKCSEVSLQRPISIFSSNMSTMHSVTSHNEYDDVFNLGPCGLDVRNDFANNLSTVDITGGVKCIRWQYEKSEYVSSIISEFNLVCEQSWLVDLVSTFYMAGRLLSCLTHGYFSDKYGRKKVLIGSHALKLMGGVLSLYASNYPIFVFSRFIIAIGSTAACMASFVLLVECAGSKWRNKFGILFNVSIAFGGIVLPLVAYLVRDFRHLQAVYTWPQFILLFCCLILDESPRWLISQGRSEDALKVTKKIAIINRETHLIESLSKNTFRLENPSMLSNNNKQVKNRKYFLFQMFESRVFVTKTIILWYCWFVSALIYYAISLNTGRLPGSIYINTLFLTLVEIPANVVTIVAMEKFGGRLTLAFFTASAGVASFLMIPFMFFAEFEFVITALGILGKGLITVSYNTLYVETAQTYSTRIRSQAMGVSASFGRLSSMASSFLGGVMTDLWRPLPSLIFGSLALFSGSLFIIFPKLQTGDMCNNSSRKKMLNNSHNGNDEDEDKI